MAAAKKLLKKDTHEVGASHLVLTQIAEEDKTPWYRKPNLRFPYFMLYPKCRDLELTSRFDCQLINAIQIVPSWTKCMYPSSCAGSLDGRLDLYSIHQSTIT